MNSTTSLPTITDDIAENTLKSSFELNCAGCNARLTELKRQSLKHTFIEFRKIINGTGNLSVSCHTLRLRVYFQISGQKVYYILKYIRIYFVRHYSFCIY